MSDFKIGDRVKLNPNKRQAFGGSKLNFKTEYIIDSEERYQMGVGPIRSYYHLKSDAGYDCDVYANKLMRVGKKYEA